MSSFCSACYAPIKWIKTSRGAAMPLDAAPTEDGNIMLPNPLLALVLNNEERQAARAAGEPLYKSHFATCPMADRFRKKAAAKRNEEWE